MRSATCARFLSCRPFSASWNVSSRREFFSQAGSGLAAIALANLIDEDLFARMRAVFTDAEVLDLTMCVAVYVGLGRALEVLGIDEACAIDL